MTDIAITPAARRAAHLPDLARREQALLSETLGSLFTRPDLDAEVSSALGYPDWPPPLTLLPDVAPSLTSATPQLDAYLPFAASACHEALTTLARDGWPAPSVPGAADAAWLLLQHADASNEDRHGLLPAVADAVRRGDADPRHLALLTDRTLVSAGKPQRYGTLRLIRDELPRLLYPLEGSLAHTDRQREVIGLPRLVDDARFAFSPLNPYGVARSCPTNAWQPEHAAALRPQPVSAAGHAAPPPVPDGAVGVYLAATLRYRNQTLRLRRRLPSPLHSTGRWLDIDPFTRASCQLDANVALNQLAAALCLADVARSRLVVAFAQDRRSHGLGVEIGAALAHGIPVILIGPPRCSFDMLPDVTAVASLDDALTVATDYAVQLVRESADAPQRERGS